MSQAIQIKLVLGHSAQWRKKPTQEGYTHDWTILVRGEDGQDIRHFVEKVIFFFTKASPNQKEEPPYQVSESGYGSFNLPIEVYFRNKDEPKKVRFEYDLLLPNLNDPPINQIRSECLTFQNPSEEFKSKLLKAGGTLTGAGGNSIPPPQKIKRSADEGDLQQHKKVTKPKKIKKSGGDSSGSDSSSDSESDDQPPQSSATKTTKSSGSSKKSPNTWDTTALKRLHKHLNSLQDPQRLQEIVNIIEQTGQYNLTQSTFDFDLCKLDDHTLNKLSKFMDGNNMS